MRYWQPLNNAKAVNELGLTGRPLETTLNDALTWFKANGYLKERLKSMHRQGLKSRMV